MSTYKWSVPTGKAITGTTYIKDTDNNIADTISDLVDFVNGEGSHLGQGLTYDMVDKASTQTITGVKTFTNGITSNVTGNLTGNADTATKLATTRTISLTGDIAGSATFDGTANATINTVYAENPFPSGGIIMWSGPITDIPDGWFLCNGLNGTPNLVDRFVVGAGGTYAKGATGGSANAVLLAHNHTFSGTTSANGSHNHSITAPNQKDSGITSYFYLESGGQYSTLNTNTSGNHTHTFSGTTSVSGTSGENKNLPPYYALAYIMKA